jgi:hypothetical protein
MSNDGITKSEIRKRFFGGKPTAIGTFGLRHCFVIRSFVVIRQFAVSGSFDGSWIGRAFAVFCQIAAFFPVNVSPDWRT